MSSDTNIENKDTFEEIFKQIQLNARNHDDPFLKTNQLRLLSAFGYNNLRNDKSAAKLFLDDSLEKCCCDTVNPNTVVKNAFTTVKELLRNKKKSTSIKPNWEYTTPDLQTLLPPALICCGSHEDCRHDQISQNDLLSLFGRKRSLEADTLDQTFIHANDSIKRVAIESTVPQINSQNSNISHSQAKCPPKKFSFKSWSTTQSDVHPHTNTPATCEKITRQRTQLGHVEKILIENRDVLPIANAAEPFLPKTNNGTLKRGAFRDTTTPNTIEVEWDKRTIHANEVIKNDQKSTKKGTDEREQNQLHSKTFDFKTARDELAEQNIKKYGNPNGYGGNNAQSHSDIQQQQLFAYGSTKKSLGGRRNVQSKFIPPIKPTNTPSGIEPESNSDAIDDRLKHLDPKMVELIRSEIMVKFTSVDWDDIAGLEYAKSTIQEAVVWPILRPDIFTGLRRPPRGILLFGPPGTGKTLIGKCIAYQSKSTFFSISASSLTSKWIGDGEKMVRALFAVAAVHQPSVVFIDEIDSLLSQRSDSEHESSRRIKTEFLVQLDGATTGDDDRILIVGATNRPQELDEAARRRLVKRLYIPLPELEARVQILQSLLRSERNSLTPAEIKEIAEMTEGFSGADMKNICQEASMEPIRAIPFHQMSNIDANEVRGVMFVDFKKALSRVRASVSPDDLTQYVKWDHTYGAGTGK